MTEKTTNLNYLMTVFITGAAVLIIEVAAVRVLSPVYGSSLYVLSSVLTIILTALSLGYWYGGKLADRQQSVAVLYSIIAGSGICVLFLLLLSKILLPTFGSLLSPSVGPLIFSFGLFFLPAFLLGIVSPYVIKLQSLSTSMEHIGTVVGATFFWGTCGSIVGSLATGYLLIPNIGLTRTIMLVGTALVALGVLMPLREKQPLDKRRVVLFLSIAVILGLTLAFVTAKQKSPFLYSSDGVYSSINIRDFYFDEKPVRFLHRDTNNSSAIYLDSEELVLPYARFFMLAEKLLPDSKNALVLGGGAYTMPLAMTRLNPNIHVDVVEIEPVLFELSKQYFNLNDTSRITNYVMDARVFLNKKKPKKYDYILGDVFGTDLATPFHLTTHEFYQQVSDNLTPNGVFFLNVIGIPDTSQPSLIGSLTKTLRAAFSTVKVYTFGNDPTEVQNVVFVARADSAPININIFDILKVSGRIVELNPGEQDLSGEIILTDDRAPVEYLMSKQYQ